MVDFFIDKILNNEQIKEEWFSQTKDLIKHFGFKEMINSFLKASEEVNEIYYNKNFPSHIFKTGLNIVNVADDYELKPKGAKLRICPFHEDKNPSLSLSKQKECFNCFGCGKKGNLITFITLLKKLKKDGNNN